MNRKQKGYNSKARQVLDVKIHTETERKIQVEFQGELGGSKYDESNTLVLPTKKRKTSVKKHNAHTVKLLSKKQRKFYEKVLEKKKKKERRALLTKELRAVQSPIDILDKLTSITTVQTKGRKRVCNAGVENIELVGYEPPSPANGNFVKVRIVKGKSGRDILPTRVHDPNVVGFETSDSSDSEPKEETELASQNRANSFDLESEVSSNSVKIDGRASDCVLKNISKLSAAKPIANVDFSEQSVKPTAENDATKEFKTTIEMRASNAVRYPKLFVAVDRDPDIEVARSKLPIIGEEQRIMEAINENDIVIIAGETGCGKTTQIPQFLYEAGFASNGKIIGVTEPRKIAAISMSQRVARELNLPTDQVSYLVRFEGNSTAKTQIKFMTDGVLMKEIQKDAGLDKYSAIIIDEAHERSVFTDILIGLLTRIVPLRRDRFHNPLKLIIMSATLRLSDFTENGRLFRTTIPPVIKIGARQFDVTVHFSKTTPDDYMTATFKKVCKIHTQLPDGGILIFLTGQQEVNALVRKLRETFPASKEIRETECKEKRACTDSLLDSSDEEVDLETSQSVDPVKTVPNIDLEDYAIKPTDEELDLSESLDDIKDASIEYKRGKYRPLWVLPLYALLPRAKQAQVFEAPPSSYRLCVVATNVAETSLTIPNVKYVIDSGRTKRRVYDKLTGVSTYNVDYISKASAEQRAGRAGRTSEGHCYRLYSSAVYEDEFPAWEEPEIRQKPIDDVMLVMKACGIDKVVHFPFPTPPDVLQLISAEKRLTLLGALEQPRADVKGQWVAKISPLGKSMAVYPVAARFAKMLCMSRDRDILSYLIAIVAALSIQEVLLPSTDDHRKRWRDWVGMGNSLLLGDVMVFLKALGAAECVLSADGDVEKFCQTYGLRTKAILEARKLRAQLTNEVNLRVPNLNLMVDPNMPPPSDAQAEQLRQMILAGMVDHVARRLGKEELKRGGFPFHKAAYRTADMGETIFLHSSSVLRKLKPEWIVFQEVFKVNDKFYARGITAIETDWLPVHAPLLCNGLTPLKDLAPFYNNQSGQVMCYLSGTFGRSGWQLPVMKVEFPNGAEKYKWFAKFLLDGSVFPKLEEYSEYLLGSTDWFFRTWGLNLTHKLDDILRALQEEEVNSKEKLLTQWKTKPMYLIDAYLEWLPKDLHADIKSLWPPV